MSFDRCDCDVCQTWKSLKRKSMIDRLHAVAAHIQDRANEKKIEEAYKRGKKAEHDAVQKRIFQAIRHGGFGDDD